MGIEMKLNLLFCNILTCSLLCGVNSAEKKGIEEYVEKCIERGVVDSADQNNVTPLHLATLVGNEELITRLLNKGASILNTNDFGTTVLHIAASEGHCSLLRRFLFKDFDRDFRDMQTKERKETALHRAVITNHIACAQELLEYGCSVNLQDCEGQTPLHWALERGSLDMVKLLISNGADISITDNKKQNALHKAAYLGPQFATYLLLKAKDMHADINNKASRFQQAVKLRKHLLKALDSSLVTPVERAHHSHQNETARILKDALEEYNSAEHYKINSLKKIVTFDI